MRGFGLQKNFRFVSQKPRTEKCSAGPLNSALPLRLWYFIISEDQICTLRWDHWGTRTPAFVFARGDDKPSGKPLVAVVETARAPSPKCGGCPVLVLRLRSMRASACERKSMFVSQKPRTEQCSAKSPSHHGCPSRVCQKKNCPLIAVWLVCLHPLP